MGQRVAQAKVRYGEREHLLLPGGSLSLGRHVGNDVVIPCESVSRFHATLRWARGEPEPSVLDLGSQNKTRLGDREVGRRHPAPIAGGGSVLWLGERAVRIQVSAGGALLRGVPDVVALVTDAGDALSGRLRSRAELIRLLGRLEDDARTGTLRVRSDGGQSAAATLCLGRLMAVRQGTAQRTRALERLLNQGAPGTFEFVREFEPTDDPMNLRFSAFLVTWQAAPAPRRRRPS